jgi:hypothetical protein
VASLSAPKQLMPSAIDWKFPSSWCRSALGTSNPIHSPRRDVHDKFEPTRNENRKSSFERLIVVLHEAVGRGSDPRSYRLSGFHSSPPTARSRQDAGKNGG